MSGGAPPRPDAEVGLCARCRHAVRQESARGSVFWRCRRAEEDPAYRRYPPLPVRKCPGFEGPGPDKEADPRPG